MSGQRLGLIAGIALAASSAASANVIDLHFEDWELTGVFTYNHQLNGHELGTSQTINPGGLWEITVTSTIGTGGWDYQVVIDYSEHCLECLNPGGHSFVTISGLTGSLEVDSASASLGNIVIGADTIAWNASTNAMLGFFPNPPNPTRSVTISWNAVPAQGAIALLGLGAITGVRRRRSA